MSFVYNQIEVFRGCSSKTTDFSNAEKLANFYVNNSNPNKQDLEQFCKEADFEYNLVFYFFSFFILKKHFIFYLFSYISQNLNYPIFSVTFFISLNYKFMKYIKCQNFL